MTGDVRFRAFDTRPRMFEAALALLQETVADAIARRGEARLVLPGGTTPIPLLEALGRAGLSFEDLIIVPSDERLVPVEHSDSNEGAIRRHLDGGGEQSPRLISLVGGHGDLDVALAHAAAELGRLGPEPFDLTVLGMGDDGHVASLFPGAAHGEHENAACIAVRQAPIAPRISLTPPRLNHTRCLLLLLLGAHKRRVLETALEPGPASELPVRHVLVQQSAPANVYWAP